MQYHKDAWDDGGDDGDHDNVQGRAEEEEAAQPLRPSRSLPSPPTSAKEKIAQWPWHCMCGQSVLQAPSAGDLVPCSWARLFPEDGVPFSNRTKIHKY